MKHTKNKNLRLFLKRKMRALGYTYKDVAKKMGVSESAIKKWMSYRDFKVENLIKLGKAIDINFFDMLKDDHTDLPDFQSYSIEQDQYFASHPLDFVVFLKLRHSYNLEEIKKDLNIDAKKAYQIIRRLEKYKIGQLWPSSKFKMKLRGPFALIPQGRMQTELWSLLRNHLYSHFKNNFPALTARADPTAKTMCRNFELYLTEESQHQFVQDLIKTIGKYAQIAESELESKKDLKPISAIISVDQYDGWKGCILGEKNEN